MAGLEIGYHAGLYKKFGLLHDLAQLPFTPCARLETGLYGHDVCLLDMR